MTLLDSVVASAAIIQATSSVDCSVLVIDRDGLVLAHYMADFHRNHPTIPKFQVGDILPPDAMTFDCIKQKKMLTLVVPREVFGFKWKTQNAPIIGDNGEILGVISVAVSIEAQDTLYTTAQTIAATSEEMTATTEELGANAAHLAAELAKARSGSENVLEKIGKTDDILKFVSDLAANSNLLGLNAAIEAARAGEHGRGFAVVAEEIRKMASNSTQSVGEIKKILQGIHQDTVTVVKTIINTSQISEQQAIATQGFASTMEALTSTANDIERVARNI